MLREIVTLHQCVVDAALAPSRSLYGAATRLRWTNVKVEGVDTDHDGDGDDGETDD
jgi:hypothetical protein